MPLLNRMRNDLAARGFEILGVNLDDNLEWASRFLREQRIDYPLVTDPAGDIPALYGVEKMPAAFFIDRKGKVREIHYGFKPSQMPRIRHVVEVLLKEES